MQYKVIVEEKQLIFDTDVEARGFIAKVQSVMGTKVGIRKTEIENTFDDKGALVGHIERNTVKYPIK